ncbi:MAG: peptidase M75 family protein [Kineosporiaceae bacterium]|nr:peptidase M75 family protein [Kineosporiaceae bacterium]
MADLSRSVAAEPVPVLRLDRWPAGPHRGRRPRLRRPRPAGGRRAAGPEHLGLRCQHEPGAVHRPRHRDQGNLQPFPRHDLARVARLGRLRGRGHAAVPAAAPPCEPTPARPHPDRSPFVNRPLTLLGCASAALTLALTGCTDNPGTSSAGGPASGALSVVTTDDACRVSATEAPSGTLTFSVTNEGTTVTEFYVLASDKLRIIGEVENIGPGLTRDLVLKAPAGSYVTACKPGMTGAGIQAAFTVTESGADLSPSGAEADLLAQANTAYSAYVKDQTEQLVAQTSSFVAAYTAGRDDEARGLYPTARVHWERIETVAESFGDLDPRMDAREADLEPGQDWTGWHVMEKDLWPPASGYTPLTPARRRQIADLLVTDTATLFERTRTMTFTADQIGNGAKGLLDEVATGKVTGEEEIWSHTDLWDFQANVDGARVAWQGLQPLLRTRDAALDAQLATRFADLQRLLDSHRRGDGFVTYDTLTPVQVKALSDAVNALSEPISRLTAAVV